MKVFFGQPEFDGQLLRALTYAPVGGADLGECLTTAARIKEGDCDSWYQEWTATADRIAAEGAQSLENGHLASALESLLRASNYYRTSYFFLGGSPIDPRLVEAYDKHANTFAQAVRLLPYDTEPVSIPFHAGALTGYFYKASNHSNRPTILVFPGYDGTQQECYFSIGKSALDRGFNVLCIDGPGQGELLIKRQIYMIPEWNEVVSTAIDFLIKSKDVNSDKIVLVGLSWGSMLASLAATKESRLAALVVNPGQYDALLNIKKVLPQVEELLEENNYTVLDQVFGQFLADPMLARKFKYKMWVHGVETAIDLLKAWTRYSLIDSASNISCPTLVVDGENEPFSHGQAKQLFDALTCRKEYLLSQNADGAGEHCGAGALIQTNQRIFNYIEETLKNSPLVSTP